MLPDGSSISLKGAFACAARGVAHASRGRNFRIQLGFAAAALLLSAAFSLCAATGLAPRAAMEPAEWACVLICIGAVLGGECVNTSLEAVVDLVSPSYHELAKAAKDCAAGGVLVMSIASLAVGIALFAPRLAYVLAATLLAGAL